ncbi:MAG TPA: phosphopantetheine-binding protein [Iamia sp.]|nr:phosphopantetheine-binding protein [Iamia sp.]
MTDAPLLWLQEELEDDTITLEDNFLDVGGNSYLAMQLAEMLYAEGGFKLDMRRLYELSLAEALDDASVAVS